MIARHMLALLSTHRTASSSRTRTFSGAIRALNDKLRQHLTGGMAVITPGVAALGPEAVERIVKTIAVFDDFCRANDPYEEHDFWSFEADGHMIMFKIDYLDRDLSMHMRIGAHPCSSANIDAPQAESYRHGRWLSQFGACCCSRLFSARSG